MASPALGAPAREGETWRTSATAITHGPHEVVTHEVVCRMNNEIRNIPRLTGILDATVDPWIVALYTAQAFEGGAWGYVEHDKGASHCGKCLPLPDHSSSGATMSCKPLNDSFTSI